MTMEKYANMGYNISPGEDVFSTASGLADDFDAIVVNAHFAPDAQYHSGQTTLLHLTLLSDDPDVGEQKIMYSCGSGWESVDGGKTVVHEKKRIKFMKTSIYGRLIDRLMELGMGELLRARGHAPFDANMLLGFKAHWNRESIEFKGVGAPDATSRLFPTAFLGFADEEEIAKAYTGVFNLSGNDVTPVTAGTPAPTTENPDLVAALTAIARSNTKENFIGQALQLPNVSTSQYFAKVIDPNSGFYEELKGE